jgi:hypothetical protein
MKSFSDDINSLLPSGYKNLHKRPISFQVIDVVNPRNNPLLSPFIGVPFQRSIPGFRVKVFTCLLRASSN